MYKNIISHFHSLLLYHKAFNFSTENSKINTFFYLEASADKSYVKFDKIDRKFVQSICKKTIDFSYKLW